MCGGLRLRFGGARGAPEPVGKADCHSEPLAPGGRGWRFGFREAENISGNEHKPLKGGVKQGLTRLPGKRIKLSHDSARGISPAALRDGVVRPHARTIAYFEVTCQIKESFSTSRSYHQMVRPIKGRTTLPIKTMSLELLILFSIFSLPILYSVKLLW